MYLSDGFVGKTFKCALSNQHINKSTLNMVRSTIQHFPNSFGCDFAQSWQERTGMDRQIKYHNLPSHHSC